ncbi:MAG: LysR family transcriptional regulator [Rhizobiaceae bacterium]|nr:LysR family transcriptional regulator [Rhizobiaceae bacterium]
MPYIESLRVFVRTMELGSITAGGRDLRITPAVASNRIKELENRLGVRLFNRTTRNLSPTEVGKVYYEHAKKVVESVEDSEAIVAGFSDAPRGAIRVTAPLGIGRRAISPLIPKFVDDYPHTQIRLRLSDRKVDIFEDGLDVAFFIGEPADSNLKLRKIADCERILCAAPEYLKKHGTPESPGDLIAKNHNCLLLRYPRSPEYFWSLNTPDGMVRLEVSGKYDADDGDVLTRWAIEGYGIVNKPLFDVADQLERGELVEVLPNNKPKGAMFGCLYPHKRLQDPKIRYFVEFMVENCRQPFTPN